MSTTESPTPAVRASALNKLADMSGDAYPKLATALREAARRLRIGLPIHADTRRQVSAAAGVPVEIGTTALRLIGSADEYPNPKVNALLRQVGDFGPRDLLDAALALLDQANVRSAASTRAYDAIEAVIEEQMPEEETQ